MPLLFHTAAQACHATSVRAHYYEERERHLLKMPTSDVRSRFYYDRPSLRAEVCHPVPGKDAFNADYQIFSEIVGHKFQIVSRTFHVFVEYGFTGIIDDTYVHRSCMKIDSDVKLMLVLIESH